MRGDDTRRMLPDGLSDAALWRRTRLIDASEDEAERYLDFAGYADGRLDPDDRERVAEWLAGDPAAAGDVAAARVSLAPAAAPEPVIARACALVDGSERQHSTVIPFRSRHRYGPPLHGMARWGSLVAAMAVASWVGFTLGMDTSLSVAQVRQTGEDSFLGELVDPSTDLMRDLTEGTQT
jgi:anti-sigma factor RsiW